MTTIPSSPLSISSRATPKLYAPVSTRRIQTPKFVVYCTKSRQTHFHGCERTTLSTSSPLLPPIFFSSHIDFPSEIPCCSSTVAVEKETARCFLGSRMAVGLGVVAAGTMMIPEYAHAAEGVASNTDFWTSLVAAEPKNALSLPTWVIHVASVVECLSLPCRMFLDFVFGSREVQSSFREMELANALSLPTWFIHVASVVEWITAMGLVWRYGDTPGNSTWKGLSWGMVPLLGGAMCACTWHFFYNAQSLEILVVLQAALTLIGNFTMWAAAFRIYQASRQQSRAP